MQQFVFQNTLSDKEKFAYGEYQKFFLYKLWTDSI
jgi:hypothetical protein